MKKKLFLSVLACLLIFFLLLLAKNVFLAAALVANLLPENGIRPLEWISSPPKTENVKILYKTETLDAILYSPAGKVKKVVLAIHGANEQGKDDPRIVNFGQTFARAGIATLIPTFPDITREKFTPEALEEITRTFSWLTQKFPDQPRGMIAFSVAAGPMFLAASDTQINEKVDYLISFGGYYELKAVLKNVTTGQNRDPFGLELTSQQYRTLFGADESLDRLLTNTDPAKFEKLYEALPSDIKQYITRLSPGKNLANVKAKKVFLVHSDPDLIIPVDESEKLKTALGNKAELTILRSFSHVDVQFAKPSVKNIFNFYIPEAWKLYSLILRILNY